MRTTPLATSLVLVDVAIRSVIGASAAGPIATKSANDDVITHTLNSHYQAGETKVRVLLPDEMAKEEKFRVLYVLPVEAGDEDRYGSSLQEVLKCDLHNRYRLICVFPTFSQLPWYADHPTDRTIRQESYLLKDVLPLIERTYPVVEGRAGRLLVGFSKSGCGAWSLLLRHPDIFEKAAAWDAPLMMDAPGKYGSGPIFGSPENFANYEIQWLLRTRGPALGDQPRLILTGYDAFREHHIQTHHLLDDLGIPHVYRDGPYRKHTWHSGWLAESVELLMAER
ncbi:MAG: alpha/beta hydrolase-fold protein [Planctomycetaceae bacterium]